jgi:hypothetical protein
MLCGWKIFFFLLLLVQFFCLWRMDVSYDMHRKCTYIHKYIWLQKPFMLLWTSIWIHLWGYSDDAYSLFHLAYWKSRLGFVTPIHFVKPCGLFMILDSKNMFPWSLWIRFCFMKDRWFGRSVVCLHNSEIKGFCFQFLSYVMNFNVWGDDAFFHDYFLFSILFLCIIIVVEAGDLFIRSFLAWIFILWYVSDSVLVIEFVVSSKFWSWKKISKPRTKILQPHFWPS